MREIDIHFPMIPKIVGAGDVKVLEDGIKKTEIEIAQFFDWNICMMTFYDFLEQFLHMGYLFEDDEVFVENSEAIPKTRDELFDSLKHLEPEKQARALQFAQEIEKKRNNPISEKSTKAGTLKSGDGIEEEHDKPNDGAVTPLDRSVYRELIDMLKTEKIVDENRKTIPAKDLGDKEKTDTIRNIEKRSFQLSLQIGAHFLTDPTKQREVAFLVLCVARKQAGLKTYDRQLLRSFYKLTPSSNEKLERAIEQLIANCPNDISTFKFDLVVRKYNKEGLEVLHPQQLMERQALEQIVFSNMMKVPKYNAVLTGQAPPPGSAPPPPEPMPDVGELPMMATGLPGDKPNQGPQDGVGVIGGEKADSGFRPEAKPTPVPADDSIFDPYDMGPNPNEPTEIPGSGGNGGLPGAGNGGPGPAGAQPGLPGSGGQPQPKPQNLQDGVPGGVFVPPIGPGGGRHPLAGQGVNPGAQGGGFTLPTFADEKPKGMAGGGGGGGFTLPTFADEKPKGMAGGPGGPPPPFGQPPHQGFGGPPPGYPGAGGQFGQQPPPFGMPPQQRGYPPHAGGYPPHQQGGYPGQQPGYPPQHQGGYPGQQPGYPPHLQGGYPGQQQQGYPSFGAPPPFGGPQFGGGAGFPPGGFGQNQRPGQPQQFQQQPPFGNPMMGGMGGPPPFGMPPGGQHQGQFGANHLHPMYTGQRAPQEANQTAIKDLPDKSFKTPVPFNRKRKLSDAGLEVDNVPDPTGGDKDDDLLGFKYPDNNENEQEVSTLKN